MEGENSTKQSEIAQALQEAKEHNQEKKRKPWVLTPARAENFAKTAAKRRENIEKRRREADERLAFEAERRAFYEMAAKNPTGHVIQQAPPIVNTVVPTAAPIAPPTSVESPTTPTAAPTKAADLPQPPVIEKQVRFVEKPIMPDEVEGVNHEHDHDDGWMTASSKLLPEADEHDPPAVVPSAMVRQTNRAAVMADWAEAEMARMESRKRAAELAGPPEPIAAPTYRIGTGAGNHAPFEGDREYIEPWREQAARSDRYMISPEEAMQLLTMPKDMALEFLASRVRSGQRMPTSYYDRHLPPTSDEFLTHTRHYSQRHPSQLHNSTNSVRYHPDSGDNFLWL